MQLQTVLPYIFFLLLAVSVCAVDDERRSQRQRRKPERFNDFFVGDRGTTNAAIAGQKRPVADDDADQRRPAKAAKPAADGLDEFLASLEADCLPAQAAHLNVTPLWRDSDEVQREYVERCLNLMEWPTIADGQYDPVDEQADDEKIMGEILEFLAEVMKDGTVEGVMEDVPDVQAVVSHDVAVDSVGGNAEQNAAAAV